MASRILPLLCGILMFCSACREDLGRIETRLEGNSAIVTAIPYGRSQNPCIEFVLLYEYDSQGAEHLIRRYEINDRGICARSLDLNGDRFLVSRSGGDVAKGGGRTYNVHATGRELAANQRFTS